MNAGELYQAGKLADAIDAQLAEVKNHPADPDRRLFLFELAAFSGDLERAGRQIDAVRYDDPEVAAAVESYRALVRAEQTRRRVFAEGIAPKFLAEPPEHVLLRVQAVAALAAGDAAGAREHLDRAAAVTPKLAGLLGGKPFLDLCDGDDRFGSVLEVMAHGEYYWVPLEQVDVLGTNAPAFPRDLIWMPARLEVRDGPAGDAFLSVLYPGTHEQEDDALRLGRATEWVELAEGPVLGVGMRTFLVGEDAVPIVEWRQLQMAGAAAPDGQTGDGESGDGATGDSSPTADAAKDEPTDS
jgi:type VI secretion system protein ImpE